MAIALGLSIVILLILYLCYVVKYMQWQHQKTSGDTFFALPLQQRRQLKQTIKRHSLFVLPFFSLLAKLHPSKTPPLFKHNGVAGPAAVASKESYQAASDYPAGEADIFVATQMKCGTTWMQQIVFEILHAGQGDLSDQGHRHMYALSPWLECSPKGSVAIEQAPLVSKHQKRIIKTHLPASLCPYNEKAKYIYVTRHPVSCYASVVDFVDMLAGPMSPKHADMLDWFCSDDFFFLNWADNVDGWWQWSKQYSNVLFVHFEDLKADPEAAIKQVSEFLQVTLDDRELAAVVNKCSFQYMKDHEESFEMAAPSIFSMRSNTRFMQRGKNKRHQDVRDEDRQCINRYMSSELKNSSYPLVQYYPDIVEH